VSREKREKAGESELSRSLPILAVREGCFLGYQCFRKGAKRVKENHVHLPRRRHRLFHGEKKRKGDVFCGKKGKARHQFLLRAQQSAAKRESTSVAEEKPPSVALDAMERKKENFYSE